jgi:hypothetical protein
MDNPQQPGTAQGVERGGRYSQNPRIAQQVLAGKAVILNYEGKRILGLNDTGSFIWSLLDGDRTVTDITCEVARRFALPLEEAESGVIDFVADLSARDLVRLGSDRPVPNEPTKSSALDAAER